MKKLLFAITLLAASACGPKLAVVCEPYGNLSTGEEAHAYILTNSKGSSAKFTDYGARISCGGNQIYVDGNGATINCNTEIQGNLIVTGAVTAAGYYTPV